MKSYSLLLPTATVYHNYQGQNICLPYQHPQEVLARVLLHEFVKIESAEYVILVHTSDVVMIHNKYTFSKYYDSDKDIYTSAAGTTS